MFLITVININGGEVYTRHPTFSTNKIHPVFPDLNQFESGGLNYAEIQPQHSDCNTCVSEAAGNKKNASLIVTVSKCNLVDIVRGAFVFCCVFDGAADITSYRCV